MREKDEDWNKQLDTAILEACGLNELFSAEPAYIEFLSKLEGLRKFEVDFHTFRKTVFEAISIIQGMLK